MKSETMMNSKSNLLNVTGWLFGIVFFAIGVINTLWGNDPGFGVFIVILSLVYVPPLHTMFKEMTGLSIPGLIKFLLGIFIIWAALGVGELSDKIDLMMKDL